MISYEEYAKIRDSKGMKDSDVSKQAGFFQSVLSDWKYGKSTPKMDKMQKIADVLDVNYFDLVDVPGKFSAYNPNRPPFRKPTERELFDERLLELYHNATPDAQKSVMTLLENSQKDASLSSKEA